MGPSLELGVGDHGCHSLKLLLRLPEISGCHFQFPKVIQQPRELPTPLLWQGSVLGDQLLDQLPFPFVANRHAVAWTYLAVLELQLVQPVLNLPRQPAPGRGYPWSFCQSPWLFCQSP